MRELHISKSNIRDTKLVDVTSPPLAPGAARLKLDLFALTSNNVTYAALGEGMLSYWDFFPAPAGFGKVPVWGFATVIESNAPDIAIGARYYGYYPLAETLDVTPRKTATGFIDAAPHRAAKAVLYNVYTDVSADPAYDAAFESEQTLFRPLYGTGWWAADFIKQNAAKSVVLSSASSKTALATAHQLRQLGGAELIGLTSPGNEAYVRESGLYDRVVLYDDAATLQAEAPATYVDYLGRPEINKAIHTALGAALTRSIVIGVTDWAAPRGGEALPGPKPEFFFVPTYAAERLKADPQLGAAMVRDLRAFYPASHAFVTTQRITGADVIQSAWAKLAAGQVPPRDGLVCGF
ncbi:DUF2855 family protein [Terricaulis sp.]|uniref:DUF2855 family protein n=1 Tax=Terricaulis sp. TaxID=2768686 RepID=UPI002AC723A5|nr:DUF2855 family protein [Terricaulis sp.]MDZ4690123.1 DUF2855 family protein [Terricaulis sp.]